MKFITLLLSALLLCGCLFFTSCDLPEIDMVETETLFEETEINTDVETEVVTEVKSETETETISESSVMRMIHHLGFDNVDETILKSYIPTYSCAVNVEKEGLYCIKLTTFFCDEYVSYYILLNKDGEIMKITSTEQDYNSRFVYYPREQQED